MPRKKVMVLGGTAEARALVTRLKDDPRVELLLSLAGRTSHPPDLGVATRFGGFGGVKALAETLERERIDLVIDATHPFAARMSPNAMNACALADRPYLRLDRTPWSPQVGDDWIDVPDIAAAARAIDPMETAFLTIGRQELDPLFARSDVVFVARMIEPPEPAVPARVTVLLGRPPFAFADEKDVMERHGIDVVVTKNAGGARPAKLDAARVLDLPVIMVARPPGQPPADASGVETLMALLHRHL